MSGSVLVKGQGSKGKDPIMSRRGRAALFILLTYCLAGAHAMAQNAEDVSVAPIECWARTSTNAVRAGELFTMILTCAVLETQATTAVPDQSQLDPAAIQLPPFDVVGGSQAANVITSSRRFFQYEYTLRFLGEEFGTEVAVPGPTVTYRVQSRVQQGAAVESREREYVLPSPRIRILSLVPAGMTEIRDPAPETFRAIQDRRFRAGMLRIGAFASFALTGVMVLWAVAGLLRRTGPQRSATARIASESAVLRGIQRELEAVRRERLAAGWTRDLAARTLAAARLTATIAASRPVTQVPAPNGATPVTGQLLVRSRWPRPLATLVSGSATPDTLAPASDLAGLRSAMEQLTAVSYGRELSDAVPLDEALNSAERAAREHGWVSRNLKVLTRTVHGVRDQLWPR